MSSQFSLARSRCIRLEDPSLRQEIRDYTGSDEATTNILRAINRFGDDPSIVRFDVTPKARSPRASPYDRVLGWRVRAVRP